jgi:hypothetical protein
MANTLYLRAVKCKAHLIPLVQLIEPGDFLIQKCSPGDRYYTTQLVSRVWN